MCINERICMNWIGWHPTGREGRQLAKLEKRKEMLAAEREVATPRPQINAEDMARLAAVFATVDADGSGAHRHT